MKKSLLLTLAASLIGVLPAMAVNDLYITGSTAFRASAYSACTKLFSSPPTIVYGDAAHGGDANNNSGTASWCMTGTPITGITNVTGSLTIHALFTGSVQGIQTVQAGTKLTFATPTVGVYVTNTPTIAFSDVSSASTPYPVSGNFSEEQVAVQPFVIAKSVAGGGVAGINNITWEQLKDFIQIGRLRLFSWTRVATDTNFVYLINRTKDSGTRRTAYAEVFDGYNQAQTTYLYDVTNNSFYTSNAGIAGSAGNAALGVSVVGSAGLNGVNLNWGSGYVGGGDVRTELQINNPANQSLSYLSFADARNITSTNWSNIIAYNGVWPTAAGAGIAGNTGTNDFSPISLGNYPFWAYEVVIYPTAGIPSADQNLTVGQLGDQNTPGTILGVLDYQTKFSGGSLLVGSIENEIELSKTLANGATAIRLSDMHATRQSVGGLLTP
jgi:hypothetical protein